MKLFKIQDYSHSIRPFMQSFENLIYQDAEGENKGNVFGKNWSFFIADKEGSRLLVLLDHDDGNGYTPADFKLNLNLLSDTMKNQKSDDYIIFKLQKASSSKFCKQYPLQDKTYPLGYFCDNHENITNIYNNNINQRDVDVFWCGTVHNHTDSHWGWKDIDIKYWSNRVRRLGYEKLSEIKSKRPDLNIFISKEKVSFNEYVDLISRAKICIDLPGVGYHTRRLIELLTFQKCSLACEKINDLNFELVEGRHIHRYNIDLSNLEKKIDYLLQHPERIKETEKNLTEIQHFLTHKYAIENMFQTIEERLYNIKAK